MLTPRKFPSFLAFLLVTAAVGCGGGGGGGTLQTAALRGMVVEVDGQTADRAGIQVTVLETGDRAVSDSDGRFALSGLPAGRVTLEFTARAPTAIAQQSADDNGGDDVGDDNGGDNGGDGVDDNDDGVDDNDVNDDNGMDDDNDADEDDGGRPVVTLVEGETIEIRCSLEDGKVVELSRRDDGESEVRQRLASASESPFPGAEGKVEVEIEDAGRQKIEFEVDHVPAGTVVEFFLENGSGTLVSIGTATANSLGEAELEFENALPLGASSVVDLEGAALEYRLASDGSLLFTGAVPGIPEAIPSSGGTVPEGSRARSRARLTPFLVGAEGDVEMRRRPDSGENEFEIDAQHLDAGLTVRFEIENPDEAGAFVTLATLVTDASGEVDYDTDDGFPLPLGVSDISELVGLQVRVVRDSDGEILLQGTIAPLVVD